MSQTIGQMILFGVRMYKSPIVVLDCPVSRLLGVLNVRRRTLNIIICLTESQWSALSMWESGLSNFSYKTSCHIVHSLEFNNTSSIYHVFKNWVIYSFIVS